MNPTTNNDLHRDIGGLEAGQRAMENRLDRLEKMIADGFAEMRKEISDLKQRDSQRGAFEKAGLWFAGVLGGISAFLVGHFWK